MNSHKSQRAWPRAARVDCPNLKRRENESIAGSKFASAGILHFSFLPAWCELVIITPPGNHSFKDNGKHHKQSNEEN